MTIEIVDGRDGLSPPAAPAAMISSERTITHDLGGRASILVVVARLAGNQSGEPRLAIAPVLAVIWLTLFAFTSHRVAAPPLTYAYVLPVLWLAVAPGLIALGDRSLTRFLVGVEPLMSPEARSRLIEAVRADLCSLGGHVFTVAMTLGFGGVGLFYADDQGYARLAVIVFVAFQLMAGFIAGLGFWGMWVSARASKHACGYTLDLDPTHADGFSGLACAGRMLVTAVALFYSGALFVPLGLNVLDALGPGVTLAVAFAIVASYILFGVICFFWSVAGVHDRMLTEKKRLDTASEVRLVDLLKRNVLDADHQVGWGVLRPLVYFQVRHQRISAMRVYPYDGKTILQLAASALIPLIVVLLDIYFRSATAWH